MPLTSQAVGSEWIVDGAECRPQALRDLTLLRRLCEDVIAELGLRVIGQPAWHQFPGHAGVTGLYLLSESHLACHTYPELGVASFNLYCCRSRPAWPWAEFLAERLGAQRVTVRHVSRGGEGPCP
jgi:S-adenosylmethionine decarboxylase